YTVKAVAALAGISVRALHHYDEIGLLRPAASSPAGYRLYDDGDLARLQQILFFRELGFGLKEIGPILDRPGFDQRAALSSHRALLLEKQRRLETLINSVDRTIDALERGVPMDNQQRFEGFDDGQLQEWKDEARERWGHTDAYKQSQARTSKYTQADYDAIKRENQEVNEGLAALMDGPPSAPDALALIERHYRQINDRFYDCPIAMYRNLATMWVDDPRFAANYDKVKPGLSVFVRDVAHAFCDANEG
ncbi:MAG: MerR family transcriptional regulator, partial [Cyanobacteria bacterium RYN_339]|nr:MerR family transcriptional regulator [Cyanobacteria bacterium RYN_339]